MIACMKNCAREGEEKGGGGGRTSWDRSVDHWSSSIEGVGTQTGLSTSRDRDDRIGLTTKECSGSPFEHVSRVERPAYLVEIWFGALPSDQNARPRGPPGLLRPSSVRYAISRDDSGGSGDYSISRRRIKCACRQRVAPPPRKRRAAAPPRKRWERGGPFGGAVSWRTAFSRDVGRKSGRRKREGRSRWRSLAVRKPCEDEPTQLMAC